jgi:O-antigen/teichoic acid export membrane protein
MKLLSPFSEIRNFFKQGAGLALSSVATGLSTFAVIFFGSRYIETKDFAYFLIYWAAFNTILLAIVGPLDILLPKSFPGWQSNNVTTGEILTHIIRLGIASGGVTGICLVPYLFLARENQPQIFVGLILTAFAGSSFHALRIFFTITSQVKCILVLSLVVSGLTIAFLVLMSYTNRLTVTTLLYLIAVSQIIAVSALLSFQYLESRKEQVLMVEIESVKHRFSFPISEYLQVMSISFVQLALASGVIIFATQLAIEPSLVITWVAIVSLVRIPLLVLNSFTPPIVNKASVHYHHNEDKKAKQLFKSSVGLYSLISVAIVLTVSFLAPIFIPMFIGPNYEADVYTSFLVAVSEVTVALIVLPRVFLVVQGKSPVLIKFIFTGLVTFFMVTQLPLSSVGKLFLAPVLSSLLVLALAYFYIVKIRPTDDFQRQSL